MVLSCIRQPQAKLADRPMHLRSIRIDFAENYCDQIGGDYAD